MRMAARFLRIIIRTCGGGALTLGLAFWLGHGRSFTHLHMGLGMALVVSLWVLAGIAWCGGVRTGVAAFVAGWGGLTWYLGVTQMQLLPGPLHWLVAVVHLFVGLVAIAAGSDLAAAVGARSRQASAPPETPLILSGHQ